jgi:hypothetical protein
MSEKEEKEEYHVLVLFKDGTYELYEKPGVEVKFKHGNLLREFVDDPDLEIRIVGFPGKMII